MYVHLGKNKTKGAINSVGTSYPTTLRQVTLPIRSLSECPFRLTSNQICAGQWPSSSLDQTPIRDSCFVTINFIIVKAF